MGQILRGCATTTEAVRRAIQNSQESLRALAKRYGINQKTEARNMLILQVDNRASEAADRVELIRAAFRLEYLTPAWMTVETAVAIGSGLASMA
jgi:hypothetical protein